MSKWDPDTAENVTVRLSTPELREKWAWYVMHWRPGGGTKVGPRPDDELSMANRKQKDKAKKERRKKRGKVKREHQMKDKHKEEEEGKSAASSSSRPDGIN